MSKEMLRQAAAHEPTAKALETFDPSEVVETVPEAWSALPGVPPCITQDSIPQNLKNDPAAIMVGLGSEIPRWEHGSEIKWAAWRMGYDSQEDAYHAAVHLNTAAKKWNDAKVGVTFRHVALPSDANFLICYGGRLSGLLARSYFPHQQDVNFVYVYKEAFAPGWKDNLWRVLTHELGHVLGLRHEFAMDAGPRFEGDAVQLGERNPLSVMNYTARPPKLQPSDVATARRFYKMPAGTLISGTRIVDYVP